MARVPMLDLRPQRQDVPAPANIEAEQALLGILLYDSEHYDDIAHGLRPEHFYEGFHGRLFQKIGQLRQEGHSADPIGVAGLFRTDPVFGELGGIRYLADLADRCPPAANAPDYARVISDHAMRRDLISAAGEVANRAHRDFDADAIGIIAEAELELSRIASDGPSRAAWRNANDVIAGAVAAAQGRSGAIEFGTGLADVDEHVGGFGRGELAIIAGRPGMFKSGVASQIAKSNAARGMGTLFFSQEMGVEPLGLRLACDLSWDRNSSGFNPTYDRARRNRLTADQWHVLQEAAEIARSWPLRFDVRPGLTVSTMEACARRAFREWERMGIPAGPVIIDHLGIIRPEKERQGSKHAEIADISRGLAEMAKRLDVPVIALCQLNRGVEGREDKRPILADLRQAGELEEDSRLVIFMFRPEYYFRPPQDPGAETHEQRVERETKLARNRNKLFWLIEKNNNGPLGHVETFCDVACSVVRDRAQPGISGPYRAVTH
jgi:replicative DNA helicase